MRHGNLNREEAIEIAGLKTVEKVEGMSCEPTNRVQTDGDTDVEFAASIKFIDSEGVTRTLTAYYYQSPEELDKVTDDLGILDWEINGYEIW